MTTTCDRLKEAFSKDIQVTGMKRAAKELKLIVSKPKWLKYKVSVNTRSCGIAPKCCKLGIKNWAVDSTVNKINTRALANSGGHS